MTRSFDKTTVEKRTVSGYEARVIPEVQFQT